MPDFSPTEYAVPGFVALVLIEMIWAAKVRREAYEPLTFTTNSRAYRRDDALLQG